MTQETLSGNAAQNPTKEDGRIVISDKQPVMKADWHSRPSVSVGNGAAGTTNNAEPYTRLVERANGLLSLHHSLPNGLNFALVKELALECADEILERWLPDGARDGGEYKACNPTRQDGSPGSFSINTQTGVWADFATDDKGGDLISLVAYLDGCERQTDAAVKILEFIAGFRTADGVLAANRHEARRKSKVECTSVMPIPNIAERTRPKFFGSGLGSPTCSWTYRNAEGLPLCYVNRFDTDTGKTFLPLSFCRDSSGHTSWRSMAPSVPRPAYGLERLAARPSAPVLFAEGEKAADAAQRLFPDFVAVTTMNGAKSPNKTDFKPFAGRKVFIAPDNDEAGIGYKDKLIQLLHAAGADVVGVLALDILRNNGLPLADGYDLADAEADGWTANKLAELGVALWESVRDAQPEQSQTILEVGIAAAESKPETDMEFAKAFSVGQYREKIACVSGQVLAYSDGYWNALDIDVDIKRPILRMLGSKGKASRVNAIFETLRIEYSAKPARFERKSPLICVQNGTLNPLTGELLAHDSNYFLTNRVEIEYEPDAKCDLWLQTLDEIFMPDADKAEKIQLLQEFIGYCLIPDTRMHKFLWMVGAGGNGKSLILAVLNAVIGKANISHAQIERLQEKFVRAELQGKLVNISSEMSSQATISDGYLKQIVAGDIIEAERKYERSFSFKPYARLIGATNVLPRLLDHSDGFFRRAIILRLNRQFTESEQDKQREEKLMAELSGIFNWCIAGLQNLLQRTHFLIPPSSKAEVDGYRVKSDPVRQFAEEMLEPCTDKNDWVASGELYQAYREWSSTNGCMALASNQFAERLSAVGFRKKRLNSGRYWEAKYLGTSMSCFISRPAQISTSASMYKV